MSESFIQETYHKQRQYLTNRDYPSLQIRIDILKKLRKEIESSHDELLDALSEDLGKHPIEAYTCEIGFVLRDIDYCLKHLAGWMKGGRNRTPWIVRPSKAYMAPQPRGLVLILGPWNYPFQLVMSPLVSAIAAGNAVCLKPSEYAPSTSQCIKNLVKKSDVDDLISVVEGDAQLSSSLTQMPYDLIFFTGSTNTGKKVTKAAAENLVPCVLELGGKSPCVVHSDANIALAAKRILWGKFLNAGQTCVAPDYVLVEESVRLQLIEELKKAYIQFTDSSEPDEKNNDYSRILNAHHFDRLEKLLEDTDIVFGGARDRESLHFPFTIVTGCDLSHPVMQEEIFGPILPVLEYKELDQTYAILDKLGDPLASYLFTSNESLKEDFLKNTHSGSVCINDTISQILPADLPFGGVGSSGYGKYRGRAGFEAFSNLRSVLDRGTSIDLPLRYPPYKTSVDLVKKSFGFLTK